MNLLRRPKVLLPLLAIGSVLLIGWAYGSYAAAVAAAERAQTDRDEAARLARDFARLENVSVQAAVTEQSAAEILDRIEAAMRQAGLRDDAARDALQRVQPQVQPVRVPKTDYLRRTTQIALSEVTLREAVRFAEALEDPADGMSVSQLRLTAPAETADLTAAKVAATASAAAGSRPERWTANLTLTQTIFSPSVE